VRTLPDPPGNAAFQPGAKDKRLRAGTPEAGESRGNPEGDVMIIEKHHEINKPRRGDILPIKKPTDTNTGG